MIRDPQVLEDFLRLHPQAWPVRMALIEELVRDGLPDQARRLVRDSPPDCPMPDGFSHRIHTALTRGVEGIRELPPLLGFEERPPKNAGTVAQTPAPSMTDAEKPNFRSASAPDLEELSAVSEKKKIAQEKPPASPASPSSNPYDEGPIFDYVKPEGRVSEGGAMMLESLSGGARALAEAKPIRINKPAGPPPPPSIDQKMAGIKWENYAGKLHLSDAILPEKPTRPSTAPERFSAVTLAVLFHAAAAFLVSLVVLQIPRAKPPQLVATIPEEFETDDPVIKRLTRTKEIDPAAAAAQAINVETAVAESDLKLPEVEMKNHFDVNALFDGMLENGFGMSLSPDLKVQSQVNFFGISGGGDKIVFIVDATVPMLVDGKGGMFAYEKVKNEIGAMLGGLSRGTKFNILAYDGARVEAFRSELVSGLPSNVRMAMEWLAPLNRDYENLGLPRGFGEEVVLTDLPGLPIPNRDLAHYAKCVQKAMEWQASAIFCITGGYLEMPRSHPPEVLAKMRSESPPARPSRPDPADADRFKKDLAKWEAAREKTRQWLENENTARREQGISPKVVLNFNDLVKEITGETPPRPQARIRDEEPPPRNNLPPLPPVTPGEIALQFKRLVSEYYLKANKSEPSLHMVVFLGEDEPFNDVDKDHFRDITKKNRGKLKILRGLAELKDVTKK